MRIRNRNSEAYPVAGALRRTGQEAVGVLSIREVAEESGGCRRTPFMAQGWNENGKWKRRRFKSRADAEAFVASKQLENVTAADTLRPVVTTLTQEMVCEAENAVAILADVDMPANPHQRSPALRRPFAGHRGRRGHSLSRCAQGLPGRQGSPWRASGAMCYLTGKLTAPLRAEQQPAAG